MLNMTRQCCANRRQIPAIPRSKANPTKGIHVYRQGQSWTGLSRAPHLRECHCPLANASTDHARHLSKQCDNYKVKKKWLMETGQIVTVTRQTHCPPRCSTSKRPTPFPIWHTYTNRRTHMRAYTPHALSHCAAPCFFEGKGGEGSIFFL